MMTYNSDRTRSALGVGRNELTLELAQVHDRMAAETWNKKSSFPPEQDIPAISAIAELFIWCYEPR